MRTAFLTLDWEKCLLKGGKLAEGVLKIAHFLRTGNIVKSVHVDDELTKLATAASLPPEMRSLIPRHARILYDHRSKRGGAHSSFDPNEMDSHLVVAVADWLLAELLRLFGGASPAAAAALVRRLIRRQTPLVEEIEGELLSLKRGASAREDLELLLHKRYPEWTERAQLEAWLVGHSKDAIRMALARMTKDKDIHVRHSAVLLTSPALAAVDAKVARQAAELLSRQK